MSLLVRLIAKYWPLHLGAFVLSLLGAWVAMVQPWLVKLLVDDVLVDRRAEILLPVLAGYAATHVAGLGLEIGRHYCSMLAGNRAVVDLRNEVVKHLRALSLRFFFRERTGRIMSIMTHDAQAAERLFQSLVPQVAVHASYVVVMAVVIANSGHWLLTATALLMIPFYIIFPAAVSRTFRSAFRQVQESQADISAGLAESIESTREVIAYTREEWDQKRLSRLFLDSLSFRMRAILLEARYGGIQSLAGFVSPFLIFAVGAPAVLRGDLTVGFLLAFQQWTEHLYGNARALYHINQEVQESLGAAERVLEFLAEPADPVRRTGKMRPKEVQGEIAFEAVSFSYDGRTEVLKDVSVTMPAGARVALVGPSGAGKSTLIHLIPRFFDPDKGRILLDGIDLKEIDVRWLREQIGIVFQEPFIFSGSLYSNIAFGKEGATEEEVLHAAKMARVDEFALDLESGYQTLLGERGVRLSGGQKQRVAIARAFLRDPRILIFDEATSALDVESEAHVQEAMELLMAGRTAVIIAHRLSTIRQADLILFMRDGRIVETGTHDQLLAHGGEYAAFYRLQFPEDRDEVAAG